LTYIKVTAPAASLWQGSVPLRKLRVSRQIDGTWWINKVRDWFYR